MANKENNDKNEFKDRRTNWWVWTAVAIVVFIILLLIFNRRGTVMSDDSQPTTIGYLHEVPSAGNTVFISHRN